VGCSGGLEALWNPILPWIRAYAVDPLVSEINRLRANEETGRIRYIEGYVTGRPSYRVPENPATGWFHRVSALAAHDALKIDYVQQVFNSGQEVVYSDQRFTVDEMLAREGVSEIDFLKSDTDGHDLGVLDGAGSALTSAFGILVEAVFSTEGGGSVFRDIDRVMATGGFTLAGLSPIYYTRAALPGRFNHAAIADEDRGAPSWGEFLYLRDESRAGNLHKALKFSIIAELFGVPDLAAEALVQVRDEHPEVVKLLDGLVVYSGLPDAGGYDDLISAFKANPRRFAPGGG
jgi:hypothetical protein